MPGSRKKGDTKKILVVAERREALDRDMLSVALFGWIMDKVRAEKRTNAASQHGDCALIRESIDAVLDGSGDEGGDAA